MATPRARECQQVLPQVLLQRRMPVKVRGPGRWQSAQVINLLVVLHAQELAVSRPSDFPDLGQVDLYVVPTECLKVALCLFSLPDMFS